MDIVFGSTTLEGMCHDDKIATRTLGPLPAQRLRARLDDLHAAPNLSYVSKLPGRFHRLQASSGIRFAVHLLDGCRLSFEPAHVSTHQRDGSMDLSQITAIRIVSIGEHHE